MTEYTLFFDGCSKGNPGKAGAGAVIFQVQADRHDRQVQEIWAGSKLVGLKETNNVAEYCGLIMGLEAAVTLLKEQKASILKVKGDSLLIIKQMQGQYQCKAPNLVPYYQQARALIKQIPGPIEFQHVYRTENKRADALANAALLL